MHIILGTRPSADVAVTYANPGEALQVYTDFILGLSFFSLSFFFILGHFCVYGLHTRSLLRLHIRSLLSS